MQLLIILALLLYGGKSNAKNIIEEVKPVLETIGGDDMKQALKSAEEITEVLSAVQDLTKVGGVGLGGADGNENSFAGSDGGASSLREDAPQPSGYAPKAARAISFPLAPISDIADREITYSLSKYFSA